MSRLSDYIKNNKELVYKFADGNTPQNNDQIVILKNDEWRNEKEWDTQYSEMIGAN